MQTTPYEIAIIAGGFTIVGALLGAWIGYRNALNLYNVTEFNKAATTFRNAFYPELIFLRHNAKVAEAGSSSDFGEFLFHGYIHRHLEAFEVFRDYLSTEEKARIDKAWQEYCGHYDHPNEPRFAQYSYKSTERETKDEELKQLDLQRIEQILNFTNRNNLT